jgi:hypothetical protein
VCCEYRKKIGGLHVSISGIYNAKKEVTGGATQVQLKAAFWSVVLFSSHLRVVLLVVLRCNRSLLRTFCPGSNRAATFLVNRTPSSQSRATSSLTVCRAPYLHLIAVWPLWWHSLLFSSASSPQPVCMGNRHYTSSKNRRSRRPTIYATTTAPCLASLP